MNIQKIHAFFLNLLFISVVFGLSLSLMSMKAYAFFLFIALALSTVVFVLNVLFVKKYTLILDLREMNLIFGFFFLGVAKLIWFFFYGVAGHSGINFDQDVGGVILLLCAFVIYVFLKNLRFLKSVVLRWSAIFIVASFLVVSVLGLLEFFVNFERLEFNTGVSTKAAYVYAIFSLVSFLCVKNLILGKRVLSFVFVVMFLLSYTVVCLTGTRAEVFLFPFLVAPFLFWILKDVRGVLSVFYMIMFCLIAIFQMGFFSWGRVVAVASDIKAYQNHNYDSSIGGRLSMWKAGWHVFLLNPMGESIDERNINAKSYINLHENGNPAALDVFRSHFHNEVIEVASLQGFFGVLVLLYFYVVLFYFSFSGNEAYYIFSVIPFLLVLNGQVDVLLVQGVEFLIFFSAIVLFCAFLKLGNGFNFPLNDYD